MSKYKLMPEEATSEMEQAAEKYWNDRKFKALSDNPRTWKGLYAAMRAAAPDVQGEPVGLSRFIEMIEARASIRRSGMIDGTTLLRDLRAMLAATPSAPQHAEQQPDVTLLLSLLSHARCNTCDGSGGLYDNHGNPHQCQWCHDRSKAVAAYREGGES